MQVMVVSNRSDTLYSNFTMLHFIYHRVAHVKF